VRAQIFNADGTTFGTEILVNTVTANDQYNPSAFALIDGRFVIAWNSLDKSGVDKSESAIRAQFFDAEGGRSGGEFQVNTTTTGAQNVPAGASSGGGFSLITWSDFSGVGDNAPAGIRAQMYAQNGTKFGNEFQVNSTTVGNQVASSAAYLVNGGLVVTWADLSQTGADTSSYAIRARRFDYSGNPLGADFVVNTTTAGEQISPHITALSNGKFVVSWTDHSRTAPDTAGYAVRAQLFNNDGSRAGSEFLVSTTTVDDQLAPVMTALPDGRFVAAWLNVVAGHGEVRAQLFDNNGAKLGAELIASGDFTYLYPPAITALADGRFAIACMKESDGSSTGIAAQIFDPREGPATIEGTVGNDQLIGSRFGDLIHGNSGADRLDGADGDDMLIGNIGQDEMIGGAGFDTAKLLGNLEDLVPVDLGRYIRVTDGNNEADILRGIERLQFTDGKIDVADGSVLFDSIDYARRNGDVYHAGIDLKLHYDTVGWHEGRNPNAFFDTTGYLAVNRDVAMSGLNPLFHYGAAGWQEDRDPSASFDTRLYLIHNPDVAAAQMDPLTHYLAFGMAEGRDTYEAIGANIVNGFDAQYYLFHNPDVAAAGIDPLMHFNTVGWKEGRDPNGWFSVSGYLTYYTDVATAGINPLTHYELVGWKEGRDPTVYFDTHRYLVDNPDVAAANINPLNHFLQFGIYEGRQPYNDGVWN
jgi:hypothetical protein